MPSESEPVRTLLLTGREMRDLLRMEDVIKAVEEAFRAKGLGQVQMPAKSYLFYTKYDGDLRCMPSYLEEEEVSAVKIVNVHPQNPAHHHLRSVMAVLLLIDPRTGIPLALMDATILTDMRTGAASAVASKYLARKDVTKLALVGAGRQARMQLLALLTLYGAFEEVRVFDISADRAAAFVEEIHREHGGKVASAVATPSAEASVQGADLLATTTPSRAPVVQDAWIGPGMHIDCIGADAPGKEELDPAILRRAKVVIDDWEQASHSGEINVPLARGLLTRDQVYAEIGEIVAGKKPGRTSSDEITVFSSTGLALQDALTAKLAYEAARRKGIGQELELVTTES